MASRKKPADPKLYQAAKPQLLTVLITIVVVAAVGYAIVKITHAAGKPPTLPANPYSQSAQ